MIVIALILVVAAPATVAASLAAVCRYERRGHEAHAERRRAFLASIGADQ